MDRLHNLFNISSLVKEAQRRYVLEILCIAIDNNDSVVFFFFLSKGPGQLTFCLDCSGYIMLRIMKPHAGHLLPAVYFCFTSCDFFKPLTIALLYPSASFTGGMLLTGINKFSTHSKNTIGYIWE
jgi:hypothetical protein